MKTDEPPTEAAPNDLKAVWNSQNQKSDTCSSRTMLSPSEIASLRQEAKESMEVIGDYLKHLRAMKAQRHDL
jgi:hypothetical protein